MRHNMTTLHYYKRDMTKNGHKMIPKTHKRQKTDTKWLNVKIRLDNQNTVCPQRDKKQPQTNMKSPQREKNQPTKWPQRDNTWLNWPKTQNDKLRPISTVGTFPAVNFTVTYWQLDARKSLLKGLSCCLFSFIVVLLCFHLHHYYCFVIYSVIDLHLNNTKLQLETMSLNMRPMFYLNISHFYIKYAIISKSPSDWFVFTVQRNYCKLIYSRGGVQFFISWFTVKCWTDLLQYLTVHLIIKYCANYKER